MAQFNSERYMRYRRIMSGAPIDSDRPCRACGYNLRGLSSRTRCPECGTPISFSLWRKDESVAEAPIRYLRLLRLGANLLLISAILFLVGVPLAPVGRVMLQSAAVPSIVAGVCIATHVVAVWLLTTPRPRSDAADANRLEWRYRRWIARTATTCPIIAPFVFGALALNPNLSPQAVGLLAVVAGASLIVGIAGTAAFSLYLGGLALWANDLDLSERFSRMIWGTFWGITMAVTVTIINDVVSFGFGVIVGIGTLLVFLFFLAMWLSAIIYCLVPMIEIRTMFSWVVTNATTRAAYHQRQIEGKSGATAEQFEPDSAMPSS
jgi:hypothetical protein